MADSAAEALERAFTLRCCRSAGAARPLIGVFGDGLPEAMVIAAGGEPVEVKAPPADDHLALAPAAVAGVIERFVDVFTVRFLHRLAADWYRDHAAIVFARDDVAGLTAYQYATEMRRQGMIARDGPRLLLWNLVHDAGEAAHRFNMAQAKRLLADMTAALGSYADPGRFSAALGAERLRHEAVASLGAADLGGRTTLAWRNAGRWLAPDRHVALVGEALADPPPSPVGPRIGLVGTAVIDPAVHAMLDTVGQVVADLQPYGSVWPACHAGGPDLDGLIRAVARFPLHLRASPPARFRAALLESLAGCDLVVSQVDPSDDGFGWEVPALRDALALRGVPLVDLGFRPARPDAAWLESARRRVAEAAGVPA